MKNGTVEKVFETTYKGTIKIVLPTDKEVEEWHKQNIDESIATVSSSIYKFRLWLKERATK